MRRVLAWLKRRGWMLVVGLFLLFGVELIRRGRVLQTLRDEVALARARSRVVELAAIRSVLEEDVIENEDAIAALDARIREHRVHAVRAYEEGQRLEGAALEQAFAELGF